VFNKIDYLDDPTAQAERTTELQTKYPDCIVLSARNKDDVAGLHQAIVGFFQQQLIESEIFLPWSAQELRGEIFASCEVLEERADADGAFFRFRAAPAVIARLNELTDNAS
jgi:GTP-binding protein HflX